MLNLIDAITDQGEGKSVVPIIKARWNIPILLQSVQGKYQPNAEALKADYPGTGGTVSGQARARIDAAAIDHFEVFTKVKELMAKPDFETWDQWHKDPQNKWTAKMLKPTAEADHENLPPAEDVANAIFNASA